MKLAVTTTTPDVQIPVPVSLLAGEFTGRLRKAKQMGFDGVELMVVHPEELSISQIRGRLAAEELEVAAVATGAIRTVDDICLLSVNSEVRRLARVRLHALIDFAAALGAPIVTVGGFRGRLAQSGKGATHKVLVNTLGEAAEMAATRGVRLVVEPLNRYETNIVTNAAEGLALVEEVGHSGLGLLLDTFHMNIEEESFRDSFRMVMDSGRLWHIHLGDSNRRPPGQGHIDFRAIVHTLIDIGYTGYLSAELLAYPDPDSAAKTTIKFMRQLLAN